MKKMKNKLNEEEKGGKHENMLFGNKLVAGLRLTD